jgi:hypothetical protein
MEARWTGGNDGTRHYNSKRSLPGVVELRSGQVNCRALAKAHAWVAGNAAIEPDRMSIYFTVYEKYFMPIRVLALGKRIKY